MTTLGGTIYPARTDLQADQSRPPIGSGARKQFFSSTADAMSSIDELGNVTRFEGGDIFVIEDLITNKTVSAADKAKGFTVESAVQITLPDSVAPGTYFEVYNLDGGYVDFVSSGSATIISSQGPNPKLSLQPGYAKAVSVSGDRWFVFGDLSGSDVWNSIPGLIGYYDLSDTDTLNGGSIAFNDPIVTIADKSSEGNDLTQATGTNRAIWQSGLVNGLGGGVFNGNDFYSLPSSIFSTISQGNNTVITLQRRDSDNNNVEWVVGGDTASNDWGLRTTSGEFEYNNGGQIKEATRDLTIFSIAAGRRITTTLEIYENDNLKSSGGGGSDATMSNAAIGGRGGAVSGWNGDIITVGIWNTALSDANLDLAIKDLMARAGL